jgi:TM2 domain-containing membrane protein YozV
VTYVILDVFPFDFSTYSFNWAPIVWIVLIMAIVGSGIGVLTEAMKLVSSGLDKQERR